MKLSKLWKNWTVHNLISHPLSEIVFLLVFNFSKKKAEEWSGHIHDWSVPPKKLGSGRG